jgi:hypothetical protein
MVMESPSIGFSSTWAPLDFWQMVANRLLTQPLPISPRAGLRAAWLIVQRTRRATGVGQNQFCNMSGASEHDAYFVFLSNPGTHKPRL